SKLLGQRPTVGGSASRRAATGVKAEQASNVKSRGSTGLNNREGRWSLGEHLTDEPRFPRRGSGRGTSAQHTGQQGRSHAARRRASIHLRGGARSAPMFDSTDGSWRNRAARLAGSPKACRSSESAIAAEVLMNNAG
ncbi:MAG: hypothetical protein OEV17_07165, partial [Nitrospira sp.]|nr:hypothetical protein [Nitrospira sp.]